jgi:uncharacterized protein YfaS (alpha-2-macroglobulin family)
VADLIANTRVRLTATVRNRAGVLTDASVAWTVKAPDGTVTEPPTTEHPSTGLYELEILLDQAGKWKVEAQASGAVEVAGDFVLSVRKSAVDR